MHVLHRLASLCKARGVLFKHVFFVGRTQGGARNNNKTIILTDETGTGNRWFHVDQFLARLDINTGA